MRCERFFEEQRSMTASVETALACPSCGSDRVKRRFSLFATGAASGGSPSVEGCGCGGACACGGH
jgi:hypothetical protein